MLHNLDGNSEAGIISALNSNNPLSISSGAGVNLFTTKMVYEYNEKGFPVKKTSNNKYSTGTGDGYNYVQTYLYKCD